MANCFDSKLRTPWNNTIFPGNYVTRLNSYRNQGVNAVPGVQYFSLVGALVVLPVENTYADVLDAQGQLPAGTYDLKILSPDLGPSPKPLANRPFIVPENAYIYRSSVNVVNMVGVTEDNSNTITADGISGGAVLTSTADGTFNECGNWTDYDPGTTPTKLGAATAVTVTTNKALKPVNFMSGGSGSALADPDAGQSAILVEVCYWMNDVAPDVDSVNLPFPLEAGSTEIG